MSSFGEKCCKKKSDRKRLYYKVILDEEKNVLKEILTTAAKKKLTEGVESKMHGEQWETCFDVAKELIENNTGPGAAGANQEQQQPEQQQPEQQQPEQQQPWQRREQQQQPQDGIPLRTVRPEVDPLLSASPGSSGEQ
ncbi:small heat shock protein hspG3-like [Siniperca chuatsi]|uniref:small heat shock protein hspG3-like n=1 Tax=Siniperca chuatsi TaxID=119488 RepID=UPI001CE08D7A|nr:small heat shock protein hspG3-like [Siniperca chuatsi]